MTEADLNALLAFHVLVDYHSRCPRVRELADELGIAAPTAHARIQRLVGAGVLSKGAANTAGSYKVTARGEARIAHMLREEPECPTCGKPT